MKKEFMKIVLLGDSDVGKTTLINKFTGKDQAVTATVGAADFQRKEIVVGQTQLTL